MQTFNCYYGVAILQKILENITENIHQIPFSVQMTNVTATDTTSLANCTITN